MLGNCSSIKINLGHALRGLSPEVQEAFNVFDGYFYCHLGSLLPRWLHIFRPPRVYRRGDSAEIQVYLKRSGGFVIKNVFQVGHHSDWTDYCCLPRLCVWDGQHSLGDAGRAVSAGIEDFEQ